jgi:hypothetical protein
MFCLSLLSCRKKDLPPSQNNTKGAITIKLTNVVGNKPLALGELVSYNAPNGDDYTVSTYNYYISNIVLTDENGNQFIEQESYHLIMADKSASQSFTISNIPSAKYNSISFLIGVDSVHNISGAQSGDLDPKYAMFWSWSTGYIMAKMEGKSSKSSAPGNALSFHIAGFKGANSVLQQTKLDFAIKPNITNSTTPIVYIHSDLNTWFASPNFSGFTTTSSIGTEGDKAYKVSLNYRSMFGVDSVINF